MAKRQSHEEGLKKGLEQLRAMGVPVDAPSSEHVPVLKDYLGKGREADLGIIYLLGRIADPAALELLTSIEKTAADKELRKQVRRSLFRLAQKGLSLTELKAVDREVPRPLFKLSPEVEGYLSSVDGAGGRLVWLARPRAGSGIHLLQAMVNDREGLLRVGGALVRRKELRRMIQDIREKHGVTMISVPWEFCDQILYEGFEKAKTLGRGGVEEFASLRAIFTSSRPGHCFHPVYARISTEDLRSGAWRELSGRLLDEPELRPWVLDEDWVGPYLAETEAAQESRLVLNQLQKGERFAAIVRRAVAELFSGDRGQLFARRLEDMALYLVETKRAEPARLALAVALQLKEGEPGSLDISFLTGLAQKSLAFYLTQAKSKRAEEGSLIVKP